MDISSTKKYSSLLGRIGLSIFLFLFGIALIFFTKNMNSDLKGYKKTEAVISKIVCESIYDGNCSTYVTYNVDGVTYSDVLLDLYSTDYYEGKTITIFYNIEDPSVVTFNRMFIKIAQIAGYVFVGGSVALFVISLSNISKKKRDSEFEETYDNEVDEESDNTNFVSSDYYDFEEMGSCFCGKANQCYKIIDKDENVLYESELVKFKLLGTSTFNYVNHVTGVTKQHEVGKVVTTTSGVGFAELSHSRFKIDGVNNWDYLEEQGIKIDMPLKSIFRPKFTIYKNGNLFATVESSGKKIFREEGEKRGLTVPGFYKIKASRDELDLLFICLLSIYQSSIYNN